MSAIKSRVWKQDSVQESSGPLLANASEPIQIGCRSDQACLLGRYWNHPFFAIGRVHVLPLHQHNPAVDTMSTSVLKC